jgi:transposase
MILLHADTPILLATQPADFRKGIDGIQAICQVELAQDVRSGTLFVFINRSKTMVRALAYDGTGFWLMTKRLSRGKFSGWPTGEQSVNPLAAKQLRSLLLGAAPEEPWQKTG